MKEEKPENLGKNPTTDERTVNKIIFDTMYILSFGIKLWK
jgi:hypothetical protein